MKLERQSEERFFITEDMEAELVATGYEFKPPSHIRTKSIIDLYGWQPGETLQEAMSRHLETLAATNKCRPRDKGV